MSDVSSVIHLLPRANEGFITSLGSSISANASTVPLTDVSGLVDGSTFIGVIEPGEANQQVFTGIVSVGTLSVTGVVWTRGTNIAHQGGVTIVDYVTGTATNMITRWAAQEHDDNGTHNNVNAASINTGSLTATGSVTLPSGSVAPAALGSGILTSKLENPYSFSAYSTANQTIGSTQTQVTFGAELYDSGNNFASSAFTAPVKGRWHFDAIMQVTAATSLGATYMQLRVNGTPQREVGAAASATVNTGNHVSADLLLNANDIVTVYCSGNVAFTCGAGGGSQLVSFNGHMIDFQT